MCSGSSSSLKLPGGNKVFGGDNEIAKANRRLDPLGATLATGNKGNLDPLNLNNAPTLPDAMPPTQDANPASFTRVKRPGAQQTVLAGASTGAFGTAPMARNTLLGG